MKISPDTFVKEVVRSNFKTAPLFQENNIDFCCGGDKSIYDACREAGIDPEQLIKQLETVVSQNDSDSVYINNLTLRELADYIEKRHHAYVRENIPVLKKNLEKICQVHGGHHPELLEIKELFTGSAGDLTVHMKLEELILFPLIRQLEKAINENSPAPGPSFGSVKNPIGMMMADHQNEGDRFKEISRLSMNYQPPHDACATYEVTLKQLGDFEGDLHRHIHLENNILFPKALELEQKN